MIKHKNKIIFCVITLAILVAAFVLPDIYSFEDNVSKPTINETYTDSSAIDKNTDTSKTETTISETQNRVKKEETTEPEKTDASATNNNSKSPIENNGTIDNVISVEKNSVAVTPEKSDVQTIVENEVPTKKSASVQENIKTEANSKNDIQPATKNAETIEHSATAQDNNDAPIQNNELTCSISVKCTSILNNMEQLVKEKRDIIPKNGIIFENKNAVFYENESVFNVLSRELKKNGIHFEFVKNPVYKSAYIEGIGNIYEFDCGELSGWLYKVNGITPSYGCSQYIIKGGDVIEFIYSVNMGTDIN